MRDYFYCVWLPLMIAALPIALFAVLVTLHSADAQAQQQIPKPYRITHVFSMNHCGPCVKLKAHLKANGVHMAVTETKDMPEVSSFPYVFYVDAATGTKLFQDHGELVYAGQCDIPGRPVTVVHWNN